MFFDKINKLRHTLAFRLTLWYAALFVLSAGVVFTIFYILIGSILQQRTDDGLLERSGDLTGIYALQGMEMLQRSVDFQAQAVGERKMFYRLFYKSGVVFSSSNMRYWKNIGIDRAAVEALMENSTPVLVTHDLDGGQFHARVIYTRIGSSVMLQMGYSMEDEQRLLKVFKKLFMVTMSLLLIFAVAGGWLMARRALSGVAGVTRTAGQISQDDLKTRVPVLHRHDEIDQLAITFNEMLDRIQQLVISTRQMNDNIAHDLRSPITRIRGLAEVTLTNTRSVEEFQQMAGNTIEECDRLLDMINTMLTISRTEAGVHPVECATVEISTIIEDACELFQPLAEDKSIVLRCAIDGRASIFGDHRMLQRMVANLIDNAIKYSEPGGHVTVTTYSADGDRIRFTVADDGPGISQEDQPRLFQRFFRGDQSRTLGGAGLGLSLVQAVVHAHDGQIKVHCEPGEGSRFTVELPQAGVN